MLISRSFQRKLFVTCGAILGFTLLYEANTLDLRYAAQQAEARQHAVAPSPGRRLRFDATAYCKGETTASGTAARTGIAAADPDLLPVGSVIQVDSLPAKYKGIYTVMDTGPEVQGRELDLYMWSCHEALAFGRKPIDVTVLRLGWNPRASTPRTVAALFQQREAVRAAGAEPGRASGAAPSSATDTDRTESPRDPSGSSPQPR